MLFNWNLYVEKGQRSCGALAFLCFRRYVFCFCLYGPFQFGLVGCDEQLDEGLGGVLSRVGIVEPKIELGLCHGIKHPLWEILMHGPCGIDMLFRAMALTVQSGQVDACDIGALVAQEPGDRSAGVGVR